MAHEFMLDYNGGCHFCMVDVYKRQVLEYMVSQGSHIAFFIREEI